MYINFDILITLPNLVSIYDSERKTYLWMSFKKKSGD